MYQLLLIPKFCGLLLYAAGFGAAFLSRAQPDRKRAVHRFASPGLLLTWVFGWAAAEVAGLSPLQLWLSAGFVLSLFSHGALVASVGGDRPASLGFFLAASLPLVAAVYVMVQKPVWS